MATSLRMLCFNIWKTKFERQGIMPQYKPVFSRYIGIEDENEYASIIKTIHEKSSSCSYSVFFDSEIKMQADFDIIMYVGNELKTMNVHDLKSQDISLFGEQTLDSVFLNALDYAVNLALKQESFINESSRNDFILKLILWAFSYIRPMATSFNEDYSPKCFYYGDITKHEVYFLILLHKMGFDVVYINPLREENWKDVDTEQLSKLVQSSHIMPIIPVSKILEEASVIEEEQSVTLQLQRDMEETLLSNSGVYRAWQFRDGDIKTLFIRGTVFDVLHSYAEPARVRSGFKTEGKVVTIPNMFFQIDGVYDNPSEYFNLLNTCISTPNTLIINDAGNGLICGNVEESERLRLTFCKFGDGTYDINEIKKLPYYQWDRYRDNLEDFILNKINVYLNSGMCKKSFSPNEEFDIVCDILMMNPTIVKMADGFDFTDKIPKLVIFLNNEDFVSDRILYLVGFIITLGFDVIIFNPSGLNSIDSVFNVNRFNTERLETMRYDLTLDEAKKKPKGKGFLQKLFS